MSDDDQPGCHQFLIGVSLYLLKRPAVNCTVCAKRLSGLTCLISASMQGMVFDGIDQRAHKRLAGLHNPSTGSGRSVFYNVADDVAWNDKALSRPGSKAAPVKQLRRGESSQG